MSNYLKEAFKELELLDEDVFPVDATGESKLKKFLDGDEADTESIIDPEAETSEDLKDSYEGKVILACRVCHDMHYEDPENVVFDNTDEFVNVGEECPTCSSDSGFKVVGQVAPFCRDCKKEEQEETDKGAVKDKEIEEEPVKDETNTEKTDVLDESCGLTEKREESTYFDVAQGMLDGGFYKTVVSPKTGKTQTVAVKQLYDATEIGVDDDGIFVWVADEADAKPAQGVADKLGLETHLDEPTKFVRGKNRKFHIYIPEDKWDEDVPEHIFNEAMNESVGTIRDEVLKVLDDNGYDTQDKDVMSYADAAAEYIEMTRAETDGRYSVGQWFKDTKQNYPEDLKELKRLEETCEKKAMTECVDNVEVEAAGQKVEVKSEEDKTVIEISTENKEEAPQEASEEIIVPVDEETKKAIEMNDHNFDEDSLENIDLDSITIDAEGFQNMSESYLKRVYENVNGYNVTSAEIKDKKLIVEGVIEFKSGKKSPTKFIFESVKKLNNGRIRFIGENVNLSNNKKAFTVTTSINGNKGICESFNYNYKTRDTASGKMIPLYGTIKK